MDYTALLLRHKWIFITTVVCVFAIVVGYVTLKPPTYTTEYTVLVGYRQVRSPLESSPDDPWTQMRETVAEFNSLIANKAFLRAALTIPGGQLTPVVDSDAGLVAIQRNVTITNADPNKFTVTLSNYPDAETSKVILSSLIGEFIRREGQMHLLSDSEPPADPTLGTVVQPTDRTEPPNALRTSDLFQSLLTMPPQSSASPHKMAAYIIGGLVMARSLSGA